MTLAVVDRHDALFVDLDGVIYRGDGPIPGAAETIDAVRGRPTRVLFITNNSARTPEEVAAKLGSVGVRVTADQVLTSGVATASTLRGEHMGDTAYVIGEGGVRDALLRAGIVVVDGEPDRTDLVIVGWDRSVDYAKLRRASLLVQRGAALVATNPDLTYPAPDGLWPGAGSILAAVVAASGAVPTVVGKPFAPLFRAAAEATGARHPLVVGDRLDTDIRGAANMGWDSFLVFSGASTPRDLLTADSLPTYVASAVDGVLRSIPAARPRAAGEGDVAGIARLLQESELSATGLADRLSGTVLVRTSDADEGEGRDDPVVATACVQDIQGFGLLRSVAVAEPVRGTGLGMLTVAFAVAQARSHAIRHVFLFTATAASFFSGLGFRQIDRTELPQPVATSPQAREECAESAVAMELILQEG